MTTPDPGARLLTRAFGALFAASLAFFIAVSLILPVASPFATSRLGTDAAGAGLAIGAYALAALAMRPVVGWASDRFGRRPLLVLGSVMAIGALAAHLLVTTLPAFIAVRSVLGIADAFFFVAILAAGSDLAPPERRGEAINLVSLSLYLGIAIGPPVGEAIQGVASFEAVWALAAVVAAIAAGLSLLVPESAPNVLLPVSERRRGRFIHPAAIFPGFLILTGAAGMSVFLAFLPLYAKDLGMGGAGVPFALYALIVVLLRVRFSKLPDTMGAARLSGAALAVGAVGLAIFGLVPSTVGVLAGTVVFALGVSFMFPALIALAVSRVDETERGSAVGTASAFFDLAFGMGPAVFGVLATSVGFGATFLVTALIAAFGAALLFARRGAVESPQAARASGGG